MWMEVPFIVTEKLFRYIKTRQANSQSHDRKIRALRINKHLKHFDHNKCLRQSSQPKKIKSCTKILFWLTSISMIPYRRFFYI